jgi:hypothetical protein
MGSRRARVSKGEPSYVFNGHARIIVYSDDKLN